MALIFEWFLDLLFFIGAALFAYGFWLAWHPLGFIFGGMIVAVFAFLTAQKSLQRNRR